LISPWRPADPRWSCACQYSIGGTGDARRIGIAVCNCASLIVGASMARDNRRLAVARAAPHVCRGTFGDVMPPAWHARFLHKSIHAFFSGCRRFRGGYVAASVFGFAISRFYSLVARRVAANVTSVINSRRSTSLSIPLCRPPNGNTFPPNHREAHGTFPSTWSVCRRSARRAPVCTRRRMFRHRPLRYETGNR